MTENIRMARRSLANGVYGLPCISGLVPFLVCLPAVVGNTDIAAMEMIFRSTPISPTQFSWNVMRRRRIEPVE